MAMTPAIFLDKDGTLLEDVPYNVDPARMQFAPRAREALRRLARLGYPLIVISNQPGVALGLFEETALHGVRDQLASMFNEAGAHLADFYYCVHHPEGQIPQLTLRCSCRKPAPGMLLNAAMRHEIDLARSWFIGDILDDIEAGRRAGCETVLLNNGHETLWHSGPYRQPHYVVQDLEQASLLIFERTVISLASNHAEDIT